ncbi:MAG TPA: non-homologous end-joining DNA ligase [Actinomycetota bacterium]|nr:non-homologous end-joining DNA ligase [Actinomycetota bacterium]
MTAAPKKPAALADARKTKQPAWVQPMLATLTRNYFSDPEWLFEPKLDGIRCLAFKQATDVKLLSRNKLDLTGGYPEVVRALERQRSGSFIVDGEIAAVKGDVTSFSLLQQARRQKVPIVYFIFDVIHIDGHDVTKVALKERKDLLERSLRWGGPLSFVSHIEEDGKEFYEAACARGWEGVIAKLASSRYTPGRSRDWLKFKCSNEQEFVIAGYTDPQGQRTAFGALLVGYYEDGELRYAGKVGTGYNAATLRDLLAKMEPLRQPESPFAGKPPMRKGVHWVRPRLVAQIGFSEWTSDGRLRHPRYLGLRKDKKPREVVRERP